MKKEETEEERRLYGPYFVNVSQRKEDDYFLSNGEWHSCYMQIDIPQYETGVRGMKDGKVVEGSFQLIQHDWPDFDKANDIIIKGLRKGWDALRILKVMDRIR